MRDRRVWAFIVRGADVRVGSWFWTRLLAAATTIVMSKGPRWSQRILVGRPIGVWLIVGAWLALAMGAVLRLYG